MNKLEIRYHLGPEQHFISPHFSTRLSQGPPGPEERSPIRVVHFFFTFIFHIFHFVHISCGDVTKIQFAFVVLIVVRFVLLVRVCLVRRCFFTDFPDFPGETSNLENYYLLEASKYSFLSNCCTHGYYILTKSSISKPPTSCRF